MDTLSVTGITLLGSVCRHYLAKQMLRGEQDALKVSSQLPSLHAASQVLQSKDHLFFLMLS
jgi:hypothetical protein